ncbi:hypothetical protein H4R35_005197 [Dimargaris xerosporica]|nr:hypothetical protein H4R35_005197 [Dimargaris xerosporica]
MRADPSMDGNYGPRRRSRHAPSQSYSHLAFYSMYPRKRSEPDVNHTAARPPAARTNSYPFPAAPASFRRKYSNDDVLYSRQSLPSSFQARIQTPTADRFPSESLRSSRTLSADNAICYSDSDLVTALLHRLQFIVRSRQSISLGPNPRLSHDSSLTTDSGTSYLTPFAAKPTQYAPAKRVSALRSSVHGQPLFSAQVNIHLAELDRCLGAVKARAARAKSQQLESLPAAHPLAPDRAFASAPTTPAAEQKEGEVKSVLPPIPQELRDALARPPSSAVHPMPPNRQSTLKSTPSPSVLLSAMGAPYPVPLQQPPKPFAKRMERNVFSMLRKSNSLSSDPRRTPSYADLSPTFRPPPVTAPVTTPNPFFGPPAVHTKNAPSSSSLTGSVHSVGSSSAGDQAGQAGSSHPGDHALDHQVALRDVRIGSSYEGWLVKLSITSNSIFSRKTWKRRFFVLSGSGLYRFKSSAPDALSSDTLCLTPETIVCVSDAFSGRRWLLEVTSQNIGTWFLQAHDKEDMKQWLTALKAAVSRIRQGLNSGPTLAPQSMLQPSPTSSSSSGGGHRDPGESEPELDELEQELQEDPLTPESVRDLLSDNLSLLSVMLYPGTGRRPSQSSDNTTAIASPRQSWHSSKRASLQLISPMYDAYPGPPQYQTYYKPTTNSSGSILPLTPGEGPSAGRASSAHPYPGSPSYLNARSAATGDPLGPSGYPASMSPTNIVSPGAPVPSGSHDATQLGTSRHPSGGTLSPLHEDMP